MDFDYIEYKSYISSQTWHEIASILKDRKGNKCNNCETNKHLQVHHLTYAHLYHELEYPDDTILLCSDCHKFEHAELDDVKRVNKLRGIKKPMFYLMDY
jgi:5-methylcytosine-specific restriction endonuclease McrA